MKKYIIIFLLCLFAGGMVIMAQEVKVWTLEECIARALEQNITVQKTHLSNQSLEYQLSQTKAQRFPTLSASVNQNFNWNRISNTDGTWSNFNGNNSTVYSLNSGVIIFNASKLYNQIRQSELDIEGGKFNLETTEESISLKILDAFLQVLYAEEQVKNTIKQIESTTGQVNLANERMTLQVISQADYLQVKSQLASEKLTLANAINQQAIAKVNLMQLMELPVSEVFEIARPNLEGSFNQERNPQVASIYDTALAIKPQIKNAEINKEIALLDEKIARAGFYPTLSASAGIDSRAGNSNSGDYFSQLDHAVSPSVGLSLSIPIYQRKQAKTNVALAKIGYRNAELSEMDTKNQLRKNIEQACQDVISAQTQYEASLEKFNSTKEASALSDEKFTQGIINSVDYLVSKTNLVVSESELLQSKFNLIFSYKILDFYSGIPLTL